MDKNKKPKLLVDSGRCTASGQCVKLCPLGAISIVDGKAVIDYAKCDLDGICIPACPNDAIYFEEVTTNR